MPLSAELSEVRQKTGDLGSRLRTILTIGRTSYQEATRYPLYYLVVLSVAAVILLSLLFVMFNLSDEGDAKMIRGMALDTITLGGVILSVLVAWQVITLEMEKMTALTILAKPVNRVQFLVGKFLGILGALLVAHVFFFLVFLLTVGWSEGRKKLREGSDISEIFHPYAGEGTERVVEVKLVNKKILDAGREDEREVPAIHVNQPKPGQSTMELVEPLADGLYEAGTLQLVGETETVPGGPLPEGGQAAETQPAGPLLSAADEEAQKSHWIQTNFSDPRSGDGATLIVLHDSSNRPPATTGRKFRIIARNKNIIPEYMRYFTGTLIPLLLLGTLACFLHALIMTCFSVALAPHVPLVVNGGICLGVFLVGHLADRAYALVQGTVGEVLSLVLYVVYLLLPGLENLSFSTLVAEEEPISMKFIVLLTSYAIIYGALVLLAGLEFFRRKEIR